MNNDLLTLGVIGTSYMENEFRKPIFPKHFTKIDKALRKKIIVEKGYGENFSVKDDYIRSLVTDMKSREEIFENADIILLPKPTKKDYPFFKEGQIHWGWPHAIQGENITQLAIDKKMTLIAWEAMNSWKNENNREMHIFYRNNELAGHCAILHSLQLKGFSGIYGPKMRVAVISFGSCSRGAVQALHGRGLTDITLFTQRPKYMIRDLIPVIKDHYQYEQAEKGSKNCIVTSDDGTISTIGDILADYDIIVNGILQDTDNPLIFMNNKEIEKMKPGSLIVDISCDEGMAFECAKPTTFENPTFKVANDITYYSVDHTPSYSWHATSYEISCALLPFIEIVMKGKEAWKENNIIRKALEIQDGQIINPKIISFQKRALKYPHKKQK
ncbi:MAG: alanine dehydrogenase [Candidatus Heimdallarchaeota archaeon]